ncbi:hypothetical protein AK812_SmicGene15074 [Symbiodinium microadriaticum]|uniref:Uncharacterized protein n=1 Tax=Symbiodinium microadriaticum TaxID=2951 RepID=A0A1Q9E3Z6_SYMMI|nr:hypothetical protein AK812_SmicGene15074 [Symbiodinium microadriaticum]
MRSNSADSERVNTMQLVPAPAVISGHYRTRECAGAAPPTDRQSLDSISYSYNGKKVPARPDIRVEYSKTWQTALAVLMEGRKEKCKVYNRHNRLVSLTGELEQRDFPLKVVFLEEVASIVYCSNWEIILESFLESSDLEDYIILDRSNNEFLLDSAPERETSRQHKVLDSRRTPGLQADGGVCARLLLVSAFAAVLTELADRLNLGHSVSMRLIVPLDASPAPMKSQGTLAKIEDDLFEILHGDEASFTGARNLIHSIFEQAHADIEGNLITAQVRPQEKLEFRAVGLDVLSAKGLPEVLVRAVDLNLGSDGIVVTPFERLYKLDDEVLWTRLQLWISEETRCTSTRPASAELSMDSFSGEHTYRHAFTPFHSLFQILQQLRGLVATVSERAPETEIETFFCANCDYGCSVLVEPSLPTELNPLVQHVCALHNGKCRGTFHRKRGVYAFESGTCRPVSAAGADSRCL